MKILDRYITREFIVPFIYCIIIFVFLYIIIDLFGHLDDILKQGVPISTLYSYYISFIPIIFVQTAPIAVLLSTIYVLGKFNKHNEVVAMKACGISLLQILRPFIFIGFILSCAVFLISDRIIPKASVASTQMKEENIEKGRAVRKNKTLNNVATYGTKNRLFFIGSFEIDKNTLHDITILEHDKKQRVRSKITASKAEWAEGNWIFYKCFVYEFSEDKTAVAEPSAFDELILDIEEKPNDFLRAEDRADFMNYRQLKNYIHRLSGAGGATIRKLTVDLHYKTSFPFISLVIMLIGIPFALVSRRGGALFGVGICLAISLSYYGISAVSIALGKGGILPSIVSAWLANITFASLGLILIRKLNQ